MRPTDKVHPWDPAEHLKTAEDMAAYFDAALEDGDASLVVAALGDIARAKELTMNRTFTGNCLITPNVPALVDFYTGVLGADAEGDDTHAQLRTQGAGLAIFSVAGMEGMAPGSMQGAGYGGVTLMFQVDDVDAEYARLQALGVEFVMRPRTHPWGARSFWFRDPDGNVVDFYAPDRTRL